MARKSKTKTGVVKLNLSGVEARKLVKEGEYLVKVKKVEEKEGDKAAFFAWQFSIAEGKFEGQTLFFNTSLSENSLWNLRSLLDALGVEIPDEAFELDLSEMEDLEMMVTVEHDTYEGKKQAKIVDFWAVDGENEKKGKGKKDKKEKGGKKLKATKPDEDDINDMDEEELADVIKDFELDVDADEFPKIKKLRAAIIEALEGAGEEKEEKSDKKGGKKGKGKKKGATQDEINEMDEDELEAFVDAHELDVKLDKYKTLRKKQAAVIDVGTDADVVTED